MNTTCEIKESELLDIQGLVIEEPPVSEKTQKKIMELRRLSISSENPPKSSVSLEHRILFVNDCPFMLKGFSSLLKKFFIVEKAYNGLEAFNKVKDHPKNYYDAIILDINMPIMDGVEASNKIHAFLEDQNL
jgi:response regulator RpfG family c-di-GMP phosphodiesterase